MRSRVISSNCFTYNSNRIRFLFGEHYSDKLKSWIDINYRLIKLRSKRQFLLHCKHNNIFPSHLLHIDENRFHLTHYKSKSKLARALHSFRKIVLNIEIFDLSRTIASLTNELSIISRMLSDSFPTFIWNNITNHYFPAFNNLHFKLFSSYKKKFLWLLRTSKLNKVKKIKPITFSCLCNETNNKVIKAYLKIRSFLTMKQYLKRILILCNSLTPLQIR